MDMTERLNRRISDTKEEVNKLKDLLSKAERELRSRRIEKIIWLNSCVQKMIADTGEIKKIIIERGIPGDFFELSISPMGYLTETHLELPDDPTVIDFENEVHTHRIDLNKVIKAFARILIFHRRSLR